MLLFVFWIDTVATTQDEIAIGTSRTATTAAIGYNTVITVIIASSTHFTYSISLEVHDNPCSHLSLLPSLIITIGLILVQ